MSKSFYEIHFTGEGFRTLGVYRLFFKRALRDAIARREAYDAERADWYENGDGRSPDWSGTDISCGNCGIYFGSEPNPDTELMSSACDDGPEHELAFRRVNLGGLGYQFPHCIHGMSLVTDYDNICGGCENGDPVIEEAMGYARESFLRFNDRWEWIQSAPGDLNHDTRNELLTWATDLFPKKA